MLPDKSKFKVHTFSSLASAVASNRLFESGWFIYIKGDNTRFKLGSGNKISAANPPVPTAQTFSQLPWNYTDGVTSKSPATSFAVPITATVSAANLLKKYLTSTSAAAVTLTLDTATAIGSAVSAAAGTEVDFTVDNSGGANTVTVAVGTGITAATPVITGGATLTVASGTFGKFKLIFKSATVALLFRVL